MKHRLTFLPVLVLPLMVAGCAQLSGSGRGGLSNSGPAPDVQSPGTETVRPEARPGAGARALGTAGLRPEALDQTSAEVRAAALAAPAARTQLLGETLASLGSPTETGLWLRTGLVTSVTSGRIEVQDGSGSLRVELRPSGAPAGTGGQLSLSAFTTLGLPLTQLVNLRVYAE